MHVELVKVLVGFFAIAIFSAWVFWGHFSGVIILAAATIVSLVMAWSISDYSIFLEFFLFAGISVIAYYLRSRMHLEGRKASVRIEEIQRNINVLREGVFSHRGVQEALKKKLHRFFQLRELMNNLSSHLDIDTVTGIVTEAVFNIINKADSCYFYIVDTQKQQLALSAVKQKGLEKKIKNKTGDIFDYWVFKQRQSLFIENVRKDYRFELEKNIEGADNFKSLISVPLLAKEKIIGSIRLNSPKADSFLPDDLRLLHIVAGIASVSLENTFLYLRTKELAITDSLTGSYVQKFFKERLTEEVTRSLRSGHSLGVLLIDIDFFKSYNDKYGHMAGDIVLKRLADLLNQMVEDSGSIVARYGGEEFGIILVNMTKEEVFNFAEQARKRIENETFVLRRETTKMTISAGVAVCPDDAKICEDLIKLADDALYKAKRAGRNCVIAG